MNPLRKEFMTNKLKAGAKKCWQPKALIIGGFGVATLGTAALVYVVKNNPSS